jgi:hypothetical protein
MDEMRGGRANDAWNVLASLRNPPVRGDAAISLDAADLPKRMLVESDGDSIWVAFETRVVGFNVPWAFLWVRKDGLVLDTRTQAVAEATTPRVVRDGTGKLRGFSYEQNSHGTGGGYTLWSVVGFSWEWDGGLGGARDTGPGLVEKGDTQAWMSEPLMKRLCLRQHLAPPSGDNEEGTLKYDLRYEPFVGETGLGVWRSGTIRCEENGRMSRSMSIGDLLAFDEKSGKWGPEF